MAGQDPLKPKDSGKIKLPSITPGMNKQRPSLPKPPRDSKDTITLGSDDPAEDEIKGPPEQDDDSGDKPDPAKDEELLARARKRFERCSVAEADNRAAGVGDKKFRRGRPEDQWPADVLAARLAQKRPAITVSKINTFVHQVTGDLRQNRPSISFSPVGDRSDRDAARIFKGWWRAIERDSAADIAYDTGVDDAVTMGWGYMRLMTDWENHDTFDQTIKVVRVRNAFTIYLDPDHQEPDGADARYGFITELLPRDEFEDQFPDADPMHFQQQGIGDRYKDWGDTENVRIAEYFEIQHDTKRLVRLENGHVGFYDDLSDDVKAEIKKFPNTIVDERQAECPRIMWYKITALEVLDRREWPGRWIPIAKVIGVEIDVEGKVEYQGVVRHIKGAQVMRNYWRTKQTESIANAPNTPWIMEEGQLEGHDDEWKQQNTVPQAVLTYKGTSVSGSPAPPPQRVAFAEIPAGFVNAVEGADQDMMGASGIRFDATKNERLNDESGVAIKELRRATDIGAVHYGDNFARTLKHIGRMFLDLGPKVFTRRQVITILRDDDKEQRVTLDPKAPKAYEERKGQDGKTEIVFNPNVGKYGIEVTVGPSYATKRIESADRMLELTKAMPERMGLAADLIVKNFDFEDADELAKRLAATLPPGVLQPDMKDVPPQVQAAFQQAQMQIKKLTTDLQSAMKALADKSADREVATDKIDKDFEAKLLQIASKMELSFQDRVQEQINKLIDTIQARAATEQKPNGAAVAEPQKQ